MADNFLEKREEALRNAPLKHSSLGTQSLDTLLLKNRSTRGYDKSYKVHRRQLEAILSVADKIPTARNQQVLRFRLILHDEADKVLPLIGMGRALPELHLPFPGTEPEAFIVICTAFPNAPHLGFDEGICAQSMMLKAVQIGLNGLIIKNFSPARLSESLDLGLNPDGLPYLPLTVLAFGKSAENIVLEPYDGEDINYYRKEDGTHVVPKIPARELEIKAH